MPTSVITPTYAHQLWWAIVGQSGPYEKRLSSRNTRRNKGKKIRIHLYLDKDVVGALRAEGYNISALANKLLWEHLERVRVMKSVVREMVDRAGFEPAASALRGISISDLYKDYGNEYYNWLKGRVTERTARDYVSALEKLCARYRLATLSEIKEAIESVGKSEKYVKGLRSFISFLVESDVLDSTTADVIKRVLKPKRSMPRQVFITDIELREAYKALVSKWGFEAEVLLKTLIFSGIRLTQAVDFLNTVDKSKFYIVNDLVVRYPGMSFSKGHKRVFWIYLPRDFADKLVRLEISYDEARRRTRYGKVSANTIRKWHYTFLLKNNVPGEVADFIQGRAQKNIGERHYANLTILADEWYSKIVDELKRVLEGG
nr:integrase [Pyrococcus abyssi]